MISLKFCKYEGYNKKIQSNGELKKNIRRVWTISLVFYGKFITGQPKTLFCNDKEERHGRLE